MWIMPSIMVTDAMHTVGGPTLRPGAGEGSATAQARKTGAKMRSILRAVTVVAFVCCACESASPQAGGNTRVVQKMTGRPTDGPSATTLSQLELWLEVDITQHDLTKGVQFDVVVWNKGKSSLTIEDPAEAWDAYLVDRDGVKIYGIRQLMKHAVASGPPHYVVLAAGKEQKIHGLVSERESDGKRPTDPVLVPLLPGTYRLVVTVSVSSNNRLTSGLLGGRAFDSEPITVELEPR